MKRTDVGLEFTFRLREVLSIGKINVVVVIAKMDWTGACWIDNDVINV